MPIDIEALKAKCSDDVDVGMSLESLAAPAVPAIQCRIGVEKATGRVKWCPDCHCLKYLLVVLIISLPIMVVYILMLQMSSTFTGRIELVPPTERVKIYADEEPYHRVVRRSLAPPPPPPPQCITADRLVGDAMPATSLLRESYTSFVPSGRCVQSTPLSSGSHANALHQNRRPTATRGRRTIQTDARQTHEQQLEAPGPEKLWSSDKSADEVRANQVATMKRWMDSSARPCDDFYQYACGNWEQVHPIPKDKADYDTFEMLREILDVQLHELLADNDAPRSSGAEVLSAEHKAKHLYASCMNADVLAARQLEPLFELLDSLGGWPVLAGSAWNASEFDWLATAAQLRRFNNDVLLMQWIGPDATNSDQHIIQFDQTSLSLPTRDYYLQPANALYMHAYRRLVADVIRLCGAPANESRRVADEIVRFETRLARITVDPEARANVTHLYRRLSLEQLYDYIPEIDWQRYLDIVMDQPIDMNETVVVFGMDFMSDLVQLLNGTDARTVANYMMWRFVRHRINSVDDRFAAAKQHFYNAFVGREEAPPRWKICVSQVNVNMGMAVGAMFVRRYFDESSKRDTLSMAQQLQSTFRAVLNETGWLDANTKAQADAKLLGMALNIGYPDFILNRTALDAKYADLDIRPGKYFENVLNVLAHVQRSDCKRLREPVDRRVWHTTPAVINAYYSRNKNQIVFPAGILQPPFYHRHLPRSFNFGGIGVVIGHEMAHGFDDKGRYFDPSGNLRRWWSGQAIESFNRQAECFVSQYGQYRMHEIGGVAVNGASTHGENIADNAGLRQAYRAYDAWLRGHCQSAECVAREQLPGLNVTHRQLFFLNFAQIWCGRMRPEATMSKLKTSVHSPAKYRVIGKMLLARRWRVQCTRGQKCVDGAPISQNARLNLMSFCPGMMARRHAAARHSANMKRADIYRCDVFSPFARRHIIKLKGIRRRIPM